MSADTMLLKPEQAGVSLQVIGAILGHSTIQTTMRYAHLVEDSKREAISRLNPANKPSQAKKKSPRNSALSR